MTNKKDRLRSYLISAFCLFVPLCLVFWYYFLHTPGFSYRNYQGAASQMEEDPDSAYIRSLEDLPYWMYRHKADSIHQLQHAYTTHLGLAINSYPFGIGRFTECDTCARGWFDADWKMPGNRYYLVVGGFKQPINRLEDFFYKPVYYKKLGQSYLKYVQYDTIYDAGRSHVAGYKGHWVSKPIRYQAEKVFDSKDEEMRLMIPVSKTAYRLLQITMFVILGLGLVLFWLSFRKFVQVLVAIAQGNAFTVNNYQRLFFITNTIGAYMLCALLMRLVLQWALSGYYSGDLVITTDWWQNAKWTLFVMAFYFIARAFKTGYDIQHEQELTI